MTTMIVLFNLKPGRSAADCERSAKENHKPTVKSLKSITDFNVYRSTGMFGSDATPPYQYCEIVEINNIEQLNEDFASEKMQKVANELYDIADNPIIILTEHFA